MKRVVRSKSGREIYGPKWLNNHIDSSSTSVPENGEALPSLNSVETARVSDVGLGHKNQTQMHEVTQVSDAAAESNVHSIAIGMNRGGSRVISDRHDTMYRATIEGDWVAAEMLLEVDPKLGSDDISEDGDRALHVAASMKHNHFVLKLVELMTPSELEMVDGRGYTACCYAAISGSVDIVDLMIRKNPTLAFARDWENKTPFQKAAMRGNTEMVLYFLKSSKIEDMSKDEWFDFLLVAIRRKMYGVALEILGNDEQLATMRNDEGTALHLLARQTFFIYRFQKIGGVMRGDMRLLAKKLLEGIQKLGQANAIEEMKNPPILFIAAEEGNVELVTMLTHAYPHLVWQTNNRGYTIFHIAANYRIYHLFWLIEEIGARKDFIAMSQDEDGNNILHLAAELAPQGKRRFLPMTVFNMQREVLWFKKVKAIVPPLCWEMKNKEGYTPRQLFNKRHKSLLEQSKIWVTNTADSCMLISTLIFTVVFASAFAVPGGYSQETGIPMLYRTNWFTCFILSAALAMFSSALCIVCFLRIMIMGSGETTFENNLSHWLVWGINGLTISVFGAISAFMSAYFMIYTQERPVLVESLIVFLYAVMIWLVCIQIWLFLINLPQRFLRKQTRHTLFERPSLKNKRRMCWVF